MLRRFDHSHFSATELALAKRDSSAAVCVIAGRSFRSLQTTLESCRQARSLGLVDEVLVVGSSAAAEGAAIAAEAEAEWVDEAELLPALGPVLGKGDAMWRSLSRLDAELICFCDGDLDDFGLHYVVGLLGPLLGDPTTEFVKATYARPFGHDSFELAGQGGRVTELLARPTLEAWFPEAGELRQPLGGEVAARRGLFRSLPFMTGYAVEAVMAIDVISRCGLGAVAEVDLGSRSNDHQPIEALGRMAREIMLGISTRLPVPPPGIERIAARLGAEGRVVLERPPMDDFERGTGLGSDATPLREGA